MFFSKKLIDEKIFKTSFPIKKGNINFRCQTPPSLQKRLGLQKWLFADFSENNSFFEKPNFYFLLFMVFSTSQLNKSVLIKHFFNLFSLAYFYTAWSHVIFLPGKSGYTESLSRQKYANNFKSRDFNISDLWSGTLQNEKHDQSYLHHWAPSEVDGVRIVVISFRNIAKKLRRTLCTHVSHLFHSSFTKVSSFETDTLKWM